MLLVLPNLLWQRCLTNRNRLIKLGALLCTTLLLVLPITACVSVDAFQADKQLDGQLVDEEHRIWYQAEKIDQAIVRSEQLYNDPQVDAYVQGILDELFPDFTGQLRVKVLKAPVLNAFALPNGSIYMNSGLLAALDSEAQMAAVLAHEGIHVLERHSMEQRGFIQNTANLLFVARLLLVPVLPELVAISSIYGFSREHEREADRLGFDRLVQAGYQPAEGKRVFQRLYDEVEALEIEQPFFFASHPELQERIDNFDEFIRETGITSGVVKRPEYHQAMQGLRMQVLAAQVENGMYKSVILKLDGEQLPAGYSPAAYYHLGEAYQLRGDEGDADKAVAAWQRAIKLAPNFAASYRELGIVYYKQGKQQSAQQNLQRYLQLAPAAQDAGYIRDYLTDLQSGT